MPSAPIEVKVERCPGYEYNIKERSGSFGGKGEIEKNNSKQCDNPKRDDPVYVGPEKKVTETPDERTCRQWQDNCTE